ncbi:MAG: hypothetical protein IT433_08655 [Phycisphaerales bacterium]|nr:hypothetical protein [Phycisphaerales bacterium]
MIGRHSPILRLSDRAVEWIAPDGTVRAQVVRERSTTDDARLAAWRASLPPFVAAHHLAGARVDVVYASATGVSSVVTLPAGLGSVERRSGAFLSLAESLTLDLDSSPHDAVDVSAGAGPRQMLAAADQAGIVADVYALATASGLHVRRLVPEPAFEAARAMAAVSGRRTTTPAMVSLWVGNASSVLVARDGGAITMVRAVPVGVWTLLDALERPFTAKSSGNQVSLDRADAERVLLEHGVPGASATVTIREGVVAQDLAPALVPIVRRLAVELKQTIRFGIASESRAACSCVVVGPGAAVPGLAETVGEASGVPNCTSVTDAGAGRLELPTLLPMPERARREGRRGRALLWSGVAVAAIAVGVEGVQAEREAMAIERLGGTLLVEASPDAGATLAPAPLREAVDDTLARVRAAWPVRAPWHGLLASIAREAPEQVRVSRIEFAQEPEGATCSIHGTCLTRDGGVATLVGEFTRRLSSLPAVEGVRLGEVTSEVESVDFSLELRLRLVPVRLAGETIGGGGTP